MSAPQRRLRLDDRSGFLTPRESEQRYPALRGQQDTAVAVVGGGMTGALVAHAFASAGISTTVLEAALVGSGSTAASSALLLKEPDLELTDWSVGMVRVSAGESGNWAKNRSTNWSPC